VRKSQETRSQTRSLSTFPYVQNAPSVAQARLRGVGARRHNCGAPAPVKIKIKIKLNVTEMHFWQFYILADFKKCFISSHNYEKFKEFKTNNLKACDKTQSRKKFYFEKSCTVSAFFGKF